MSGPRQGVSREFQDFVTLSVLAGSGASWLVMEGS